MSSNNASAISGEGTPALTGGIPTSLDLAPSIVTIVLFFGCLAGLLYRLASPRSRWLVLIRVVLFVALQIAGFIIRCIISQGNDSTGLFIGDQICALCGFIAVCEPVVAVFQRIVSHNPAHFSDEHQRFIVQATRILRLGLLAAIGVGIGGATLISGNMTPSQLNTFEQLREANSALVLGIIGVCLLGFLALFARGVITVAEAFPMLWASTFIEVVAGYKLYTTLHSTNPYSHGTKAGFYCLLVLPELLATLPFFVYNLKELYPEQVPQQGQGIDNNMAGVPQMKQEGASAESVAVDEYNKSHA